MNNGDTNIFSISKNQSEESNSNSFDPTQNSEDPNDNRLLVKHFSHIAHAEIPIFYDYAEEDSKIEASLYKQVISNFHNLLSL